MSRAERLFTTNIRRLALLTLPTWLRRPLCGALLFAGITPLARLTGELRAYRKETTYRLTHNGQVCKLRAVLNDEFDPEERRIAIEESDGTGSLETGRIWMRSEGKWVMLPQRENGTAMIHREGFGGTSGYDFWVSVPSGMLDADEVARLKALTNMYKLASKRYAITYK
ncbi:MAG: hypothetical protein J1E97_08255 [Muribaculaceae bacterium]|nr:hypothetical protein [Muribaculaceae bacterium]